MDCSDQRPDRERRSQDLRRRLRALVDEADEAMTAVDANSPSATYTAYASYAACASLAEELLETLRKTEDRFEKVVSISDMYQAQAYEGESRLRRAMERIEVLSAVKPSVCLRCRKASFSEQDWEKLEHFYQAHPNLTVQEALCPECAREEAEGLGIPPLRLDGNPTSTPEKKDARERLDPALERLRRIAETDDGVTEDCVQDLTNLLSRYDRLQSRLNKIVTISDRYQAQLRDVSTRMELMARTDVLTGLPNRRDMLERLDLELNRARRYGGSFAIAIFDMDDFKSINDNYSHDCGDEVLKRVAGALKESLRSSDSCARWGGEEFLGLFPEATVKDARVVAEKCRCAVEGLEVVCDGRKVQVSLSGGIAIYGEGMDREVLLKRADEALYQAKAAGKNRVFWRE